MNYSNNFTRQTSGDEQLVDCNADLNPIPAIVLTVWNSFLAPLATVENTIILLTIYKTASLQNNSSLFICSLAVADLMVGIIMNPVVAVKSSLNITYNMHPLSIFTECLTLQTLPATTFSLCAISIDRYIAITMVFRYEELVTTKRCVWAIGLYWVSTLILPAVRLTITDVADLPHLWTAAVICTFVLPMAIICYCYYHIWKAAKQQGKRTAELRVADKKRAATAVKNVKAAWTIGIIIGVCVLLWTPSFLMGIAQNMMTNECSKKQMNATWMWGQTIVFSLSTVDPIIYAFRNSDFMKACRRLLVCRGNTVKETAGTWVSSEGKS